MANIKELRGRIKSVRSIQQITRAMEMVASMKLRKVQAKALAHRPYTVELRNLGQHLSASLAGDAQVTLFKPREVKTVGVFLVASDRGLCGAYNASILSRAHDFADRCKEQGQQVKFFVYGRKGYSYLQRRGFEVERFFVEPPLDKMDFASARIVVGALVEQFEAGDIDEVRVFYTSFLSASRFAPDDIEFLPVPRESLDDESAGSRPSYLLEPDPEALLNLLLPKYLETVVYDAMLQSLAAEHASRRVAMKGATDAATRMTTELKRVYNRVRQEAITKELLDIVGGTAAVS